MKIAVSIPDSLFEAAEQEAQRRMVSRSHLYAQALDLLLRSEESGSITARLDALYSAEESSLDPPLAAAQAAAIDEPW